MTRTRSFLFLLAALGATACASQGEINSLRASALDGVWYGDSTEVLAIGASGDWCHIGPHAYSAASVIQGFDGRTLRLSPFEPRFRVVSQDGVAALAKGDKVFARGPRTELAVTCVCDKSADDSQKALLARVCPEAMAQAEAQRLSH